MLSYRIAEKKDMAQTAKVHAACFPDYFLTTLGEGLLEKYYTEFFEEEPLFAIAEDNGKIVGFCMGYLRGRSAARSNFIKKNAPAIAVKVGLQCLRLNKVALAKLKSFFIRPKTDTAAAPAPEADGDLLSICVLPEYRGSGASAELVRLFETCLRNAGCSDYLLSVYKTNAGAIKFYEKTGLERVYETADEYKFLKKLS